MNVRVRFVCDFGVIWGNQGYGCGFDLRDFGGYGGGNWRWQVELGSTVKVQFTSPDLAQWSTLKIRRTREVRDRLIGETDRSKEKEKKKAEEKKAVAVWNPSFKPEDFMEDGHFKSNPAGPSKSEGDKKEEEERGNGLDLNLSL
ncbi:hypothetical protein L1049_019863 [Liquidambar formosana]|uniref:Uncharacterized protein n=1 Tax=Liquidambar formosana TaxID=63359 RepID=A0AAP0S7C2_LIQFO